MEKLKIRQLIKYILINIIIAALIVVVLINYVFSAFKIDGDSMSPTFSNQDRFIISKVAIKNNKLKRFDIVILKKPDELKKTIVKRIIGLPGETVAIKKGEIYINNKVIKQPFLKDNDNFIFRSENMAPLVIQQDHYFILGDNRMVSRDSRYFGQVNIKLIFGRACFRYWPFSRMGRIR